eukprot:CAMPEP_0170131462 /NCGR_PEP_ID=MMETSP0020_2-20130122/23275_1 /TAXON_ID=98059 /ORGANISM="Dinobryon sp., Strain UTEXLB2267" /LENGTH=58 /DNA_ID=CAMNT_0010366567 /DNA_START=110 /DNA_END=286 /DNA_ORIENTATION=+
MEDAIPYRGPSAGFAVESRELQEIPESVDFKIALGLASPFDLILQTATTVVELAQDIE